MNERCCHNVLRTCRIAASTSGKPVTPRCHRRRCSWSELQRCAANHGRNGLSGRVGKLTRLRDAHRDVMHIGRDRTLTSAHDAAGSNMRSRHAFQHEHQRERQRKRQRQRQRTVSSPPRADQGQSDGFITLHAQRLETGVRMTSSFDVPPQEPVRQVAPDQPPHKRLRKLEPTLLPNALVHRAHAELSKPNVR